MQPSALLDARRLASVQLVGAEPCALAPAELAEFVLALDQPKGFAHRIEALKEPVIADICHRLFMQRSPRDMRIRGGDTMAG